MLEKVFNYIKDHPSCAPFDVAKALDVSPLDILATGSELSRRGFITYISIDGEITAYTAIKETFVDDSEFCSCFALYKIETESTETGYWDVCCTCGKRLKHGFHYYPEYEGLEYDIRLD